MSKKILLIAGVLLAAGSVAAISAPHFRGGGHMRHGPHGGIFGEGGDLFGGSPVRLRERLKEMDANADGIVTLEEFLARRGPTFSRFDKNNDGVIDRADTRRILSLGLEAALHAPIPETRFGVFRM